jgi:hypothetical protein
VLRRDEPRWWGDGRKTAAGRRLRRAAFAAALLAGASGALAFGVGHSRSQDARLVQASFDSGSFGLSDYAEDGHAWEIQCNAQRALADCAQIVGTGARSGSGALRVVVRQGDSAFGWNEQTELVRPIPNDGQSDAYHQYHAVAPDEGPGDEYWYHLSVNFDIRSHARGWHIFWQWHGWDAYSPPLSFSYNFSDLQLSLFAGQLVGDSGLPPTLKTTNALVPDRGLAINVPFRLNRDPGGMRPRWHDLVVHVRWTPFPNDDGFVEVFHKYDDQPAYRKVIDLRATRRFPGGIPTMHLTSFDRDGNPSQQALTNYMKFGYYRKSYCSQPTAPSAWRDPAACGSAKGVQPTDIVYVDDFRQGLTRADVDTDSAGPTSVPPTRAQARP